MESPTGFAGCLARTARWLLPAAIALITHAAHGALPEDEAMTRLAASSGCTLCHEMHASRTVGEQVLPTGPAWIDIARKYKGRPDAEDLLTRVILMGSGSDLGARHWVGRTSPVEMPPNPVEINETDARRLAAWILSLAR